MWAKAPGNGWTDKIVKPKEGIDQIEVGLLGTETAADAEDVKMGGLLGVVGKDEKMSTHSVFLQWYYGRYANHENVQNQRCSPFRRGITLFQKTRHIRFPLPIRRVYIQP